ncbi:sugar phosphate isomerase/epimerase family protein [Streptomyces sp. H39-S7]|uniref:sugar phosphate isomerase/epimerase family protein n=1 Tax=Streptomyces sp. H39-S7 TaxID=3004357 RepID=UPI0022AF1C27|nr:TIM barrel protein [Streptomyces sp. H39-S7]MCZ4125429.1 TIM barrel protein [Streptomyces sp. H39-S7]
MDREPARVTRAFAIGVDQATAGYRLALADLVPAAGRAGIPVLEVPAFAVADYLAACGHLHLLRLLGRHRLRIGQLSCGTGVPADVTVPAAVWPQALAAWQGACRLATLCGAGSLSVFVPRAAGEGAAAGVPARLAELAEAAAVHGLAVNVELHAPGLLEKAGPVWAQTGAPNARLLVDVVALALAGLDPAGHIAALPPGAIGWVHLADLPHDVGDGRPRRVMPGAGRLPLPAVLTALHTAGYCGPVSIEVPRAEPYGRETAEHLTRAAAALRRNPLAPFFTPMGGTR